MPNRISPSLFALSIPPSCLYNTLSDSAKTVTVLRTLANLTRNNFADTVDISGKTPDYKLSISNANLEFTEVDAYVDPNNTVITTSQNPDTKFDGKTFFKNIFVSKKSFFK